MFYNHSLIAWPHHKGQDPSLIAITIILWITVSDYNYNYYSLLFLSPCKCIVKLLDYDDLHDSKFEELLAFVPLTFCKLLQESSSMTPCLYKTEQNSTNDQWCWICPHILYFHWPMVCENKGINLLVNYLIIFHSDSCDTSII